MTAHPSAPRDVAPVGDASGEADLWCTYAAIRTLSRLGRVGDATDADATAAYLLGRRNADGGYAWSRGMVSDAWATFYCTQALLDLGVEVPAVDRTLRWVASTWSGDAFGMTPAQQPDVWATHFATRTVVRLGGADVPDRAGLLAWLRSLQTAGGGLSWSPGHAAAGAADVRACHYGVATWQALASLSPVDPPWDVPALVSWLRAQQRDGGGFTFSPDADVPCLWATYRATAALRGLDARPAASVEPWLDAQRGPSGAFVRWPGYDVEDVWASFCAVGSAVATDVPTEGLADAVSARIAELACAGGGYTYREPALAADVLTTASTVLLGGAQDVTAPRVAWLETCLLPNEGGVMYMPARGAEVRCTLWALAAGAFRSDPDARDRIAAWLRALQNPDGGFGYWEGRGSDPVSTAAAVEAVRLLGADPRDVLDVTALGGYARDATPAGLRGALQVLRIRHALGDGDPSAVTRLLERHHVAGGGWANEGARVPDLLSTYEAVVTACRHGVDVDPAHVRGFLDRVGGPDGVAWSPLAPPHGGPLAACLHGLLRARVDGATDAPPALTLS